MAGYRKRGTGRASGGALIAALALGLLGLVALFRATSAEEGESASLLGVPLESVWPGAILFLAAIAVAIWSMRAMHLTGSREPRTDVISWHIQPMPGTKYFGDPPALPSHRAELASQGLEAYRLGNGQWAVRRAGR